MQITQIFSRIFILTYKQFAELSLRNTKGMVLDTQVVCPHIYNVARSLVWSGFNFLFGIFKAILCKFPNSRSVVVLQIFPVQLL